MGRFVGSHEYDNGDTNVTGEYAETCDHPYKVAITWGLHTEEDIRLACEAADASQVTLETVEFRPRDFELTGYEEDGSDYFDGDEDGSRIYWNGDVVICKQGTYLTVRVYDKWIDRYLSVDLPSCLNPYVNN